MFKSFSRTLTYRMHTAECASLRLAMIQLGLSLAVLLLAMFCTQPLSSSGELGESSEQSERGEHHQQLAESHSDTS